MYDVNSILQEQERLIRLYKKVDSLLRHTYCPGVEFRHPTESIIRIRAKLRRQKARLNAQIHAFNNTLKYQGDL